MKLNYEDLLAFPIVIASKVARFVGLDLGPADLQRAADFIRKPDATAGIQ